MLDSTRRSLSGSVSALAFGAGSAGVWLMAFLVRLSFAPRNTWFARDDAVITLSHARNAALYGTIGVSPGDRVEGFSSPLHFAIAYVIERFTAISWGPLTIVILAGGLTLVAVSSQVLFTRLIGEHHSVCQRQARWFALLFSTVVALSTVLPWTSAGWMGSGMENPLVVAAGMMAILMACVGKPSRLNAVWLGLLLAAFALARVEFAGLVIGIVPVAAWLFADRFDEARQKLMIFFATGAISFVTIAAVHLARRAYFGQWLPNTALVQDRLAPGYGQAIKITLYATSVAMMFATATVSRPVAGDRRLFRWRWHMRVLTALLVLLGLVTILVPSAAARNPLSLLRPWAVRAPLLALAILFAVRRHLGFRLSLPGYLSGFIATLPLAQFVIFGPARLADFRIAILAVPFLSLWLSISVIGLWEPDIRAPGSTSPARQERPRAIQITTTVTAAIMIATAPLIMWTDRTRELNYGVEKAPSLISAVHGFRDNNLAPDGLVLLANPDLGKVSFDKSAVITDLGFLGDPVTARLRDDPEMLTLFVREVVRPDVIEGHGWICPLESWLKSADFGENYEFVYEFPRPGTKTNCFRQSRYSIWQRTDAGPEIALTNLLLTSTDPLGLVEEAVAACAADGTSPFRCESVRRSVQRAVVVLRRNGTLAAVVQAFEPAPSYDLDRMLLLRPPGWGERATTAFKQLAADA